MKCKKVVLALLAMLLLLAVTGCSSSSSSYNSTRESRYDAKYGQGEFKKDLDLYNSMKNAWPGN